MSANKFFVCCEQQPCRGHEHCAVSSWLTFHDKQIPSPGRCNIEVLLRIDRKSHSCKSSPHGSAPACDGKQSQRRMFLLMGTCYIAECVNGRPLAASIVSDAMTWITCQQSSNMYISLHQLNPSCHKESYQALISGWMVLLGVYIYPPIYINPPARQSEAQLKQRLPCNSHATGSPCKFAVSALCGTSQQALDMAANPADQTHSNYLMPHIYYSELPLKQPHISPSRTCQRGKLRHIHQMIKQTVCKWATTTSSPAETAPRRANTACTL